MLYRTTGRAESSARSLATSNAGGEKWAEFDVDISPMPTTCAAFNETEEKWASVRAWAELDARNPPKAEDDKLLLILDTT